MATDTTIFNFLARVDQEGENGCWNWTGSVGSGGYGIFSPTRKRKQFVRAHRYAYEAFIGPIPTGFVVDHLCCNRRCVNPDHLEPVTFQENIRRAAATITHCPRGHPFDEANTYITKEGGRVCRRCHNDREKIARKARYVPRPRAPRHGELCPTAKLSEAQVREIHLLRSTGNISHALLASRFDVNQSTISRILSKKRWSHI